jgi:putative molybdopterin biosynthesis protein
MVNQSIFTPEEVAETLKITKNTVYELIKRGDLVAYKVGNKVRVDQSDLIDYINRSKGNTNKQSNTYTVEYDYDGKQPEPFASSNSTAQIILCGQDRSLDILANMVQHHPEGADIFRSHLGSFSGLLGLYYNRFQMTASHLWDGDTGDYNVPYVRRLVPGIPCVILRIAKRTQGFYVPKGNPKNITTWLDLTRKDVTLINREKGSGTRVLLDENLRLLSVDARTIKGYENEETSHLSIASAVSRGKADVGVGNESVVKGIDSLDFIPLKVENYDLVIKKIHLHQPIFHLVYDILNSDEFKEALDGLSGYDTQETGQLIDET